MASPPQAILRIGSRGSPLALAQAAEVQRRLLAAHPGLDAAALPILAIRTSGDRIQDRALAEAGGKGLFTKELEEALLGGAIEAAVHSMKDVPTFLPPGLDIACLLEREDPRDALILRRGLKFESLGSLPQGARIGTASLRRQAQLLHRRPDLRISTLRGNIGTRLKKLDAGTIDATLLALAGLKRLGLTRHISGIVEPADMLPAVAQGAIGIEIRSDDEATRALLAPLHHEATGQRIAAERAMLAVLDGSCRTPIAGLAEIEAGGRLYLRAEVLRPDGSEKLATERRGSLSEAEALGADAGAELKRLAGPGYFTAS